MKMKKLTKRAIVKQVAQKTKINPIEADFYFDTLIKVLYDALRDGTGFVLPYIGAFKAVETKSMGSHLTGQHIPPHRRLKFTFNIKLARFVRVNTREYPIAVAPKK